MAGGSHVRKTAPGGVRSSYLGDLGLMVVSCEEGEIRQSQNGVYVYDTNGTRDVPLSEPRSETRPELTELYMLAFFLAYLVSVPLWVRASRRFAKVHLLAASLGLALVAYAALWAIFEAARTGPSETLPMLVTAALLGVSMSSALVLSPAIRAEVIDYDELLSGERKEGVYTAISDVVFRLGSAVSIAAAGWALEWSGYRPGVVPDARVETTVLWAMTLIPAACVALAILPLLRFGLTEREHARIMGELEQRRAAG